MMEESIYHPHILCLIYDTWLVLLHVTSDLMIFGAYLAIPACLWYFRRSRPDFPFCRTALWFGIFIIACGCTHFCNALEVWIPAYRWTGMVKFGTALVSWITVKQLVQLLPTAMSLPSMDDLSNVRKWLERPREETLQEVAEDLDHLTTFLGHFVGRTSGPDTQRESQRDG